MSDKSSLSRGARRKEAIETNRLTIDRALGDNLHRIYRRLSLVFEQPCAGDGVQMTVQEKAEDAAGFAFYGTCDWGDCENEAIAWRYDPKINWLPVCRTCLTLPEQRGRHLGSWKYKKGK